MEKTTAQIYSDDLQKLKALAAADGISQREVLRRLIGEDFKSDPEAQAILNRAQLQEANNG